MSRIGFSVLVAVCLAAGPSSAQTPDPLQPGAAAAENAAGEAKPAASKPAARPHRAPSPRADAKHAAGGMMVRINNKRLVGLVELEVGPTGGELEKVQGPLAFGRKSVVRVPRAKDCLYDIRGHYADEADTDLTGVNLCKDKTINLTDE